MKRLVLLYMTAFGLTSIVSSCGIQPKSMNTTDVNEMDSHHTSENSLDWDGIYRGILPCADCEGIQKTIYLNKDQSYRVKSQYLSKSDTTFDYSGKFTWNDKGNTVILDKNNESYFVGENTLTQLDQDGNKITGSLANNYMLSKGNYAIAEKYWKLIELNGKPVKVDSTFQREPYIIFKDEGNRFIGNGGCNGVSGNYRVESLNRISFSQALSTEMACPNLEIEDEFLKALLKADNFTVDNDELTLNKARMAPLAKFRAVYLQ